MFSKQKQVSYGGVVDEYLADQLVIFMALATAGVEPPAQEWVDGAEGATTKAKKRKCELLVGEVSLHAKTEMKIAEIILANIVFSIQKRENGSVIICERKVNGGGVE